MSESKRFVHKCTCGKNEEEIRKLVLVEKVDSKTVRLTFNPEGSGLRSTEDFQNGTISNGSFHWQFEELMALEDGLHEFCICKPLDKFSTKRVP